MGKYNLTGIREQQEEQEEEAAAPPSGRAAKAFLRPTPAAAAREPGKRSNPEFSRTTVYLRDSTKLKAVRLLQDRKDDRDLSDLIESLIASWTSKHLDI